MVKERKEGMSLLSLFSLVVTLEAEEGEGLKSVSVFLGVKRTHFVNKLLDR